MATAARDLQALTLRLAGVDWATIAERLHYDDAAASCGAAFEAAEGQYDGARSDPLRVLEILRLDRLQAAVWGAAMKGDLDAVKTALSIGDRRTRMLHLNQRSNY